MLSYIFSHCSINLSKDDFITLKQIEDNFDEREEFYEEIRQSRQQH